MAAVTVLVILYLQWLAISRQSLTGDGAHHLIAGYQAARYGQNLVNLEHPPLVKLLAATPLLFEAEDVQPPIRVQQWRETLNLLHTDRDFLRRATIRSRMMMFFTVALPLFLVIWVLGDRFGKRTGFLITAAFGLSFPIVGNLTILQTDAACTLGFALVVLTAIRYLDAATWPRIIALGLAVAFAVNVKFTGVLLGPTVLVAVVAATHKKHGWLKIGVHLTVVGILAVVGIVCAYSVANWNYEHEAGRQVIQDYCENRSNSLLVGDHLKPFEPFLLWVEECQPGLAQWATGLLGLKAQDAQAVYPCFALGTVTSFGRWWYFPLLLIVKLPIAIWVAFFVASWFGLRFVRSGETSISRGDARGLGLVILTIGVYLLIVMTSNTNLGFRHLMPILPLLYLLAAVAAGPSLCRSSASSVLLVALALESLLLVPIWMSSTNTWWLGDKNPTKLWFSAGNLEYRQNFLELERQLSMMGIRRIGVLYPVLEPEIVKAYLPHAWMVSRESTISPGWYVVNTLVEQLVPAIEDSSPETLNGYSEYSALAGDFRSPWNAIRSGEDHGYIAGTFHLYWVGSQCGVSVVRNGVLSPQPGHLTAIGDNIPGQDPDPSGVMPVIRFLDPDLDPESFAPDGVYTTIADADLV